MIPHRHILKVIASPYRENADANPVQSLLYDAMEKAGVRVTSYSRQKLLRESWDVWHLHWPAEYIVSGGNVYNIARRLLRFWLALKVARFKHIKIVWTVHNIRPHERNHRVLERVFWRIFIPNIDGIICLSETGKKELFRVHPQTQSAHIFTIPHGHYRGVYPDVMDKEQACAALGIPPGDFVAVFIGYIRAYKGVGRLIRSFVKARLANSKLLVAGAAVDSMKRDLAKACGSNSNVRLFFEFVNRHDVQKYLRAADLVILPFKEILNSGSAILALSFDRPILVPAYGALAELREIVGSDWVRLYDGELTAETIDAAVRWAKARQAKLDARAPIDALNWDRIARLTIEAFSQCATASTPRTAPGREAKGSASEVSPQSR